MIVKEEEEDRISIHGQELENETEDHTNFCNNSMATVMQITAGADPHITDNGDASGISHLTSIVMNGEREVTPS